MPTDPTPRPDFDALLRGVSRSFYLSIRLLPAALRRPVGLAYLLARATDTLADTAARPVAERLALLTALAHAVDGTGPWSGRDAEAFAAAQTDADEQRLIRALPAALAQLDTLAPADVEDVRTVLRHITRGQSLDLTRFGDGGAICALPDAAALEEYTYLVAGCVGEFWTSVCLRHVDAYARAPAESMRNWGRRFGTGLQLLNIVRDARADFAAGRCYFPADELASAGLAGPGEIAAQPQRFAPVWARWHGAARERLADGIAYAQAVNSRRIRAACALPALIGARTLGLLAATDTPPWTTHVKMPRREVHGLLVRLAFTLAGRDAIAREFRQLAGWENPAR